MSLIDDIRKALQGENKSELIDQILKEQAFYDALRNAGLTVTVADPTERGRVLPYGVLSKVMKVDLVDLITQITKIVAVDLIKEITKIVEVTTIKTIETIGSMPDTTPRGSEGVALKQATAGAGAWVSPTGFDDIDSCWIDEADVYDNVTATYATNEAGLSGVFGGFLYLTLASAIIANKLRLWINTTESGNTVDVDILKDGIWVHVYQGIMTRQAWVEKEFSQGSVEQVRIRFWHNYIDWEYYLHEVDVWQVTSTGGELLVRIVT